MNASAAAALAAPPLTLSLIGVPNCGKTALFNRLTGSRQKVANYPGVTVERKEGSPARPAHGRSVPHRRPARRLQPRARTLDEAIARDVVLGRHAGEPAPDLLVCVVDATNLRLNLRLVLELKRLGRPMIVALNMSDVAQQRGYSLDRAALERALGIPVMPTVAVRSRWRARTPGCDRCLRVFRASRRVSSQRRGLRALPTSRRPSAKCGASCRRAATGCRHDSRRSRAWMPWCCTRWPDRCCSRLVLFLMFQAVFSWAKAPQNLITDGVQRSSGYLSGVLPAGPLRGLLAGRRDRRHRQRAGVPAADPDPFPVHPRARGLRLPAARGVHARSAHGPRRALGPRLHPAAVELRLRDSRHHGGTHHPFRPRPAGDDHDRPAHDLLGAAAGVRAAHRRVHPAARSGVPQPARPGAVCALPGRRRERARRRLRAQAHHDEGRCTGRCCSSCPNTACRSLSNLALGLWERCKIFLGRVGTIILALMVVLWFLASFPAPPAGATGPAIQYSIAGYLGRGLEWLFAPIGFNWQISIALVPGLAAREVAVSALGTVYAMSGASGDVEGALSPVIAHGWSIATGLSLLAWYVFAPQCLSTLAVVRRETNSWRYPLYMAGYLFALAYAGAFITYRVALLLGGGVVR